MRRRWRTGRPCGRPGYIAPWIFALAPVAPAQAVLARQFPDLASDPLLVLARGVGPPAVELGIARQQSRMSLPQPVHEPFPGAWPQVQHDRADVRGARR